MFLKIVNILLTKHTDMGSGLLYFISDYGYTHASIGLEGDPHFYSFNYRGFCIETAQKHKNRGVKRSCCYQIEVSEQAYVWLQQMIQRFQDCRSYFKYTRLGVLCCAVRLPFQRNNYYFCSQFVPEALHLSGALRLKKPAYLYLPDQFCSELEKCDDVVRTIYNLV